MLTRLMSFFCLLMASYFVYQNRYRVMNILLGNTILRRLAVSSLMGMPGFRRRMFQSVFSGPNDWQ
ncbi:hypothetical protein EV146_10921 [Mesobacillus foraminis]|jgi:hypothetical protein|uniref:Na+/H+ antiporter n=1 Tax=Mesobacillus foraminis TaxID=279826 RepID=A0A4R2B805_9BACI|nr:hypothetical protein EV146_10921 [Mesobacillus foraminis]